MASKDRTAAHALKKLIATLFFSGYAPIAPATVGSALVAVIYFFFCSFLGVVEWLIVLTTIFFMGVYVAHGMEREWGKDPGQVVIDEAVGYLLTVAFLPHSLGMAIVGFFLFRVLDIVKPPPARRLERLPGGWGIVVDDVVAGIYGNLLLQVGVELRFI